MKLAMVIEHFDSGAGGGGGGELAAWIAGEMARRGHEVHVLCHDVAAPVSRYRAATQRASFDAHRSRRAHGAGVGGGVVGEEWAGLRIHRLRGMRLNTALGFRVFGARARAWCRRHELDVVHSFTVACPGDVYHAHAGLHAALRAQAAAMRETQGAGGGGWRELLHRLPGKRRTLLALERRAVARSRRIISGSGMMTAEVGALFGEAALGKVVELGVPRVGLRETQNAKRKTPNAELETRNLKLETGDAEGRAWFRGHYGIGAGEKVALFVGHDFRRKGLRYAIEAVARTRDWKLLVVGLGKVREYVELAGRLGLGPGGGETPNAKRQTQKDDLETRNSKLETGGGARGGARVMFVGPTREMEAVYAAADALLVPAFYEPSQVVVLEALAHGLPVVGAAHLGGAELVREHEAGAIVDDPREVGALAAALEGLPGAGSAEGRAMAERARGAAGGGGGGMAAEVYGDRLEAVYRELM